VYSGVTYPMNPELISNQAMLDAAPVVERITYTGYAPERWIAYGVEMLTEVGASPTICRELVRLPS